MENIKITFIFCHSRGNTGVTHFPSFSGDANDWRFLKTWILSELYSYPINSSSYSSSSSSTINNMSSTMIMSASGDSELDLVERSAMLTHPTASRVKAPKRRPPSTIYTGGVRKIYAYYRRIYRFQALHSVHQRYAILSVYHALCSGDIRHFQQQQ